MTLIPAAERRRTETPNAVMTTFASPEQGAAGMAVWRVEMVPGAQGPPHAFDAEQIWSCLDGEASVELDGARLILAVGDTLVIPADAPRQVTASASGFTAVVAAPAGTRVYNPPGAGDEPCDIAPKGDERLVPPWIR